MSDDFYADECVAAGYDREFAGLDGDVEFYRELALAAAAQGLPVLELACGTGRVAIPIAQAGVSIVGLDRSAAMLDVARRKAEGVENLRLVEGDMAGFELAERFGLVFIPYRSFLHLPTVAAQKACLTSVWQHLAPGGRFALNFWNPDLIRMGRRLAEAQPAAPQLFARGAGSSDKRRRWGLASYKTAEQQLDEVRVDEELDESGVVTSRVYRGLRLRYVFRYEMEHLLALCGFEVEALYGWFDRRPFTDDSGEMVWVARRREAAP